MRIVAAHLAERLLDKMRRATNNRQCVAITKGLKR
jgi:hypothetical protein